MTRSSAAISSRTARAMASRKKSLMVPASADIAQGLRQVGIGRGVGEGERTGDQLLDLNFDAGQVGVVQSVGSLQFFRVQTDGTTFLDRLHGRGVPRLARRRRVAEEPFRK